MGTYSDARDSGLSAPDAHACVLQKLSYNMWWLEGFAIEVVLVISSLWAGHALLTPPDRFLMYPAGFAFAATITSEVVWGWLSVLGAGAILIGFALSFLSYSIALLVRCLGIAATGFFWSILGGSTLVGSPTTLFGMPALLLGVSAWWVLLRFPAMPQQARCGQ